jgi:hypothetical protein
MQKIRFKEGLKSPILKSLDPVMADLTKRFSGLSVSTDMNEEEARIQREGHRGQGDMMNRQKRR